MVSEDKGEVGRKYNKECQEPGPVIMEMTQAAFFNWKQNHKLFMTETWWVFLSFCSMDLHNPLIISVLSRAHQGQGSPFLGGGGGINFLMTWYKCNHISCAPTVISHFQSLYINRVQRDFLVSTVLLKARHMFAIQGDSDSSHLNAWKAKIICLLFSWVH